MKTPVSLLRSKAVESVLKFQGCGVRTQISRLWSPYSNFKAVEPVLKFQGCGAGTQISRLWSWYSNFKAVEPVLKLQGCGAGTQTSRLWSRYSNFKAVEPVLKLQGCGAGTQISRLWSRYSNFRFRFQLRASESFWLRIQQIQSCFISGSTALLRTRLIHISPSCWTIYRLFEIILERELSTGLDFNLNVLGKYIASKNIQSEMNYV